MLLFHHFWLFFKIPISLELNWKMYKMLKQLLEYQLPFIAIRNIRPVFQPFFAALCSSQLSCTLKHSGFCFSASQLKANVFKLNPGRR